MVICKMKHNYLRKVFDGIVKIWVDAKKSNLFFKKLGRWLNFTKDIVKRKLQWWKKIKEKLKWSSKEAQILLYSNLHNSTLQEQAAFICNRLQAHEFRTLEGQQVWSWIHLADHVIWCLNNYLSTSLKNQSFFFHYPTQEAKWFLIHKHHKH